MLAVLKPGREAQAEAHLQEMGTGLRRHRHHHRHQPPGRQAQGRDRADMPVTALSDEAPVYERPFIERDAAGRRRRAADTSRPRSLASLLKMIWPRPTWPRAAGSGSSMTTRVMADTVQAPGGDAAVVRVHGTNKALAHHHRRDAALLPGRSVRRRQAGGGRSLAQPDRGGRHGRWPSPTISISAIRRSPRSWGRSWPASTASAKPAGRSTFPCDRRQLLALQRDQWRRHPAHARHRRRRPDERRRPAWRPSRSSARAMSIILIGETKGHLGQSHLSARDRRPGRRPPPPGRSGRRKEAWRFRARADRGGRVDTVHDVSDGGLLVALAEMALAGNIGAEIGLARLPAHSLLVRRGPGPLSDRRGETKGREPAIEARAAGMPADTSARPAGNALTLAGGNTISLTKLRAAHEGFLPAL